MLSLSSFVCFRAGVSLCRPGWPWTHRSTCVCLPVLGLKLCTTMLLNTFWSSLSLTPWEWSDTGIEPGPLACLASALLPELYPFFFCLHLECLLLLQMGNALPIIRLWNNIFTICFYSIPQVLNKKLSKAWHSASKDSGHAGARDIVSIQELYPFMQKTFALSHLYVFCNFSTIVYII